jgi:hypothetical protein
MYSQIQTGAGKNQVEKNGEIALSRAANMPLDFLEHSY